MKSILLPVLAAGLLLLGACSTDSQDKTVKTTAPANTGNPNPGTAGGPIDSDPGSRGRYGGDTAPRLGEGQMYNKPY